VESRDIGATRRAASTTFVRRRKLFVGIFVAIVLAVSLANARIFGLWLDVGEQPQRVEYVLALPGDDGYRAFVAAAMVNRGIAQNALVIENPSTYDVVDGFAPTSSQVAQRVYRFFDIPKSKVVLLPGVSASTFDDIDALAGFLEKHPRASTAVVTSNFHTRRARWMLRQRLGGTSRFVSVVAAPADFELAQWWQSENGFLFVITEYTKLIAYFGLYSPMGWFLEIVVAFYLLQVCFARIWKIQSRNVVCHE
jgi:uncharacterized SAM-binding protein YcdF (DUF218 family)